MVYGLFIQYADSNDFVCVFILIYTTDFKNLLLPFFYNVLLWAPQESNET